MSKKEFAVVLEKGMEGRTAEALWKRLQLLRWAAPAILEMSRNILLDCISDETSKRVSESSSTRSLLSLGPTLQ